MTRQINDNSYNLTQNKINMENNIYNKLKVIVKNTQLFYNIQYNGTAFQVVQTVKNYGIRIQLY